MSTLKEQGGHPFDDQDPLSGRGAISGCRASSPDETVELGIHADTACARAREATWRVLSDEQRLSLIGQCCTSCGKLDPSCRCGDDS